MDSNRPGSLDIQTGCNIVVDGVIQTALSPASFKVLIYILRYRIDFCSVSVYPVPIKFIAIF